MTQQAEGAQADPDQSDIQPDDQQPPDNLEGEEEEKPLAVLVDPAENIEPISRDAIIATKKDAGRIYRVWAFGGWVFFKAFTPTERDAFEAKLVVGKGRKAKVSTVNIRAKMFVSRVVDKGGRRLFRDEDYALVGSLPGPEVEKVFQAMQEINAFSDEDIEELAGFSGADHSDSGAQS